MSKISKQKALEAYPDTTIFRLDIEDKNKSKREGYIKGYNQAMQDFLKKACEWLKENFSISEGISGYQVSNDFKNYMQNESED